MIDFIFKLFQKKQIDILSDLKVSDELIDFYDIYFHDKNKLSNSVDIKIARKCLDILCELYKLPRLSRVVIEECAEASLAAELRYTVYKGTGRLAKDEEIWVRFKNSLQITAINIFHEFAHYLDLYRNTRHRQTIDYTTGCCDKVTADRFFYEYNSLLFTKSKEVAQDVRIHWSRCSNNSSSVGPGSIRF